MTLLRKLLLIQTFFLIATIFPQSIINERTTVHDEIVEIYKITSQLVESEVTFDITITSDASVQFQCNIDTTLPCVTDVSLDQLREAYNWLIEQKIDIKIRLEIMQIYIFATLSPNDHELLFKEKTALDVTKNKLLKQLQQHVVEPKLMLNDSNAFYHYDNTTSTFYYGPLFLDEVTGNILTQQRDEASIYEQKYKVQADYYQRTDNNAFILNSNYLALREDIYVSKQFTSEQARLLIEDTTKRHDGFILLNDQRILQYTKDIPFQLEFPFNMPYGTGKIRIKETGQQFSEVSIQNLAGDFIASYDINSPFPEVLELEIGKYIFSFTQYLDDTIAVDTEIHVLIEAQSETLLTVIFEQINGLVKVFIPNIQLASSLVAFELYKQNSQTAIYEQVNSIGVSNSLQPLIFQELSRGNYRIKQIAKIDPSRSEVLTDFAITAPQQIVEVHASLAGLSVLVSTGERGYEQLFVGACLFMSGIAIILLKRKYIKIVTELQELIE